MTAKKISRADQRRIRQDLVHDSEFEQSFDDYVESPSKPEEPERGEFDLDEDPEEDD